MNENVIADKSLEFAVRVVNLYKYLTKEHSEYIMSKQLLRCGTSIGANVAEAQRGQSMADFAAKMNIALKEANETGYWLELLFKTNYINESQYKELDSVCVGIRAMLVASINTAKENME